MSTDKYLKIGEEVLRKHLDFLPFSEVLRRGLEELDATNPEDIVSFGYPFMDDKMTGIFPGDLIVLGGETGTGKTTFATNIIYKASKKHRCSVLALEDRLPNYGINAVYFEMGRIRKKQGQKNYPWNAYRRNEIKDLNYKAVRDEAEQALNINGNGRLFFADVKVQMDIEILEAAIEEQVKQGTQLFLIDHLHYFDLSKGDSTKADYVEQLMVKLKDIQNRTGARIILVAHYRKMNGQKPTMDSFKDSIAIVQNANYVINLWRDRSLQEGEEEFEDRYKTKMFVPKSRNPNGEFSMDMTFDPATNDFKSDGVSFGTPTGNEEQGAVSL